MHIPCWPLPPTDRTSFGATFEEIRHIALAFDHLNFIMVVTNLVFAVGLITESAAVKRTFTPILGITLLYAIWKYSTVPEARVSERVEAM